jgi:hypothetical protein
MADCPVDQFSFFDQLCKDSIDVHIYISVKWAKTEPIMLSCGGFAMDERIASGVSTNQRRKSKERERLSGV